MSVELIDKRKLIEKVKKFHKWCIHTDSFPMIPSKRDNVGYLCDDVLFGIELEPTVKAIPVERVEQIREEIAEKENALNYTTVSDVALKTAYIEVLKIIDKALKEQTDG